jgi:hypothetical protein
MTTSADQVASVIAAYGMPENTPAWYAYLTLAVNHADAFPEVLPIADDAELHRWSWTFDQALRLDAAGFEFVPADLHGEFLATVEALEQACDDEAHNRGLRLLAWETRH